MPKEKVMIDKDDARTISRLLGTIKKSFGLTAQEVSALKKLQFELGVLERINKKRRKSEKN